MNTDKRRYSMGQMLFNRGMNMLGLVGQFSDPSALRICVYLRSSAVTVFFNCMDTAQAKVAPDGWEKARTGGFSTTNDPNHTKKDRPGGGRQNAGLKSGGNPSPCDLMDITAYWLKHIAALKVDRASGDPAPHKPLLLLVILDLAEANLLEQEILPLSGELAFRFLTYWTVVAARRKQRPDIRMPFHHMKSGGFWAALTEDAKPSPDKKLTVYAKLDSSFLKNLHDEKFRDQARRLIVSKYFTGEEKTALSALLDIPVPDETQMLRETTALEAAAAVEQGREARFRLTVIPAYNYTCALTGYRLVTVDSGSIVDAAHIHRFADSRNNDPCNGMALCKNAHWLFDCGLWTLADDYRVRVAATKFSESGAAGLLLKTLEGRKIGLPLASRYWPDPIHLAWHRNNRFRGG